MSALVTAADALFVGLIDYAGVFPPAALPLEGAVAGYRTARTSSDGWVLGRFLTRATGLEDLARILSTTMTSAEAPWHISVVAGSERLGETVADLVAFDAELGPAVLTDMVEIRTDASAPDAEEEVMRIAHDVRALPATIALVFELDPAGTAFGRSVDVVKGIAAESRNLVAVKLRCGGLEAQAFPSVDAVARFLTAASSAGLPMKATAGLHHPIRHHDAELGVMRHGFLNLLVATSLAVDGASIDLVGAALSDTDPDAFAINTSGLTWRSHRFSTGSVQRLRRRFISYGSCSFTEPVDDLRELGMLPANP